MMRELDRDNDSDTQLILALLSIPFHLHALLLAEPQAPLGRVREVAEQTLDTILAFFPLAVGKDARFARALFMQNGTNRCAIATLVKWNPLKQGLHALTLQQRFHTICFSCSIIFLLRGFHLTRMEPTD